MSWTVQVFFNPRRLTQGQGQQVLDQMMRQADSQGAGWSVVKAEGLNICRDPWPEDLKRWLEQYGFAFDDVNYCYQHTYPKQSDVKATLDWFKDAFKPYIRKLSPSLGKILDEQVEIRGMENMDGLEQMEGF